VSITPRDGNPYEIAKFQKNLMVALRLGAPEFSVGDFIWQEIKHLSDDPKKICSYSPYIMYMIEKVAKTEFPKNVTHKPLKSILAKILDFHLLELSKHLDVRKKYLTREQLGQISHRQGHRPSPV
jgi:hypothetical protein